MEPAAVNSLDVGSQKDASQVRNPRKNLQGLESASSEREEAGLPEQTGEHDSREVLELGSGSFERPDPADGSLDLLALAKLAHIIKPKFAFRGQHRAGNLFNRCIRNESAEDRKCTAHETEVVVPGGCRFLMSDLSKFRLLLEGKFCVLVNAHCPPIVTKNSRMLFLLLWQSLQLIRGHAQYRHVSSPIMCKVSVKIKCGWQAKIG